MIFVCLFFSSAQVIIASRKFQIKCPPGKLLCPLQGFNSSTFKGWRQKNKAKPKTLPSKINTYTTKTDPYCTRPEIETGQTRQLFTKCSWHLLGDLKEGRKEGPTSTAGKRQLSALHRAIRLRFPCPPCVPSTALCCRAPQARQAQPAPAPSTASSAVGHTALVGSRTPPPRSQTAPTGAILHLCTASSEGSSPIPGPAPAGTSLWLQRVPGRARQPQHPRRWQWKKPRSGSRIKVPPGSVRGPALRGRERPPFTHRRPHPPSHPARDPLPPLGSLPGPGVPQG